MRKNRKTLTEQKIINKENEELLLEDKQENNKLLYSNIRKKLKVNFKNEHQKDFWELMDKKEISIISGPAGTGKTYLIVMKALQLLTDDNTPYTKIYITKPNNPIEDTFALGWLPGDINSKMSIFVNSIYYLFEKIIGKRRVEKLKEKNIIEILPIAYILGMNIDNAIFIIDEMQNVDIKLMKAVLTRLGSNSKFFISGDLDQNFKFNDFKKSGLYIAQEKLKDIEEIGIYKFSVEDIVRNPLISKILEKLN